ncbi:MAG: hypothetical protein KIT09_15735 [Bryobacteraceae bacterium]|nr:hypothetical protein [Bryobacteraceae bacterium]
MAGAGQGFEAARRLAIAAQAAVHKGHVSRGIRLYRASIARYPDYVGALNNLGLSLTCTGYAEEAVELFRRAFQLQPETPELRGSYLSTLLYAFGHRPEPSEAHLREGARISEPRRRAGGRRARSGQLHIGYVSSAFAAGPEVFFLLPIVRNHDRRRFRVFCYSDVAEEDYYTGVFRGVADVWRDISGLDNRNAAMQIRRDRIDVLIDAGGYFNPRRVGLFTEETGAAHVSYPLYPCTTGLRSMDARIGSWATDPPGSERYMSEEPIRLDGAFACYEPPRASPPSSPSPAIARGHITFGSFNRLHKISDRQLEIWANILTEVPGSRMVFHHAYPVQRKLPISVRRRITRTMNLFGVEAGRLRFVGQRPLDEHLRVVAQVDIALDAFPYNGMTTTCESLWAGVPVVTQAGPFHVSRVGLALLNAVGLRDCVADSGESYIKIAASLAADRAGLARLRRELGERLTSSPFCDASEYTRRLERAYLTIRRQGD